MRQILLCQPHYGMAEPASLAAAERAWQGLPEDCRVELFRKRSALLCKGFNVGVAEAKNRGFDYFALLHADLEPQPGWLATLIEDLEANGLDAIHAPAAIKDDVGLTSTAMVDTADMNAFRRRLTTTELSRLPDVFTLEDIQREVWAEAQILLPNSGCLVLKCGDWFRDFKGFHMHDEVLMDAEGKYCAHVTPEDWMFGFDAHDLGLRVGGSRRVVTRHYGVRVYSTEHTWGDEVDPLFVRRQDHLTFASEIA